MNNIDFGSMFSSYAVGDLDEAYDFYNGTLGLEVTREPMGILSLRIAAGLPAVMIYPKPDFQPAGFTVLNLEVSDIEAAVDALTEKGIRFEQYDMPGVKTDARGISRGAEGPAIAWFKDPAGNIISVLQPEGDGSVK